MYSIPSPKNIKDLQEWILRHAQPEQGFLLVHLIWLNWERVGWVTISYHLFPVIGVDAHNIGINMYLAIAIMDD